MEPWVIWLLLAAALAVAEVLTVTLVLGLLAVAAVLAAGADLIGLPVAAQVLVFAAAGAGLTLAVRPVAKRHLTTGPAVRTGVAALTGRPALVTQQIDRTGGRVKLGGDVPRRQRTEAGRDAVDGVVGGSQGVDVLAGRDQPVEALRRQLHPRPRPRDGDDVGLGQRAVRGEHDVHPVTFSQT